ncbi:hypothetical protein QLQ12_03755 [Actinoplanes sp. NEAU-A12]|uniref:Hemerythrin-like domain-containing protein n=1 Tax=Actinoplanes sandaracinus TaxID=3045177 RepID=A0ABT6WDB8_9ACTN|nr:hypothetical protein [Actinoplanes sandaracinus]MDI6097715.1 hypothetical protein [Actinoplanes sandaracinus]
MAFGPERIPVVTDPGMARRLPELAVLSTLAHADRSDPLPLFEALVNALDVIDAAHAALYHDVMLTALPTATRKLLEDFMTTTDYPFQSDFARRHFAAGKAAAKAEAILAFLTARGIEVPDEARMKIAECTDLDQLDQWIQRAATAEQVADLGGPLID